MALQAWTGRTAGQFDADSPLDTTLMQSISDDLTHLRQVLYGDGAGGFFTAVDGHDHDLVNSKAVNVTADQVGQGELKKGVATLSSGPAGTTTEIVLVDYCFSPNIYSTSINTVVRASNTSVADYKARFILFDTGSPTYTIRYRYITASEGPRFAKLKTSEGVVVMKIGFDDAPPDYIDAIKLTAEANGYTYEMIEAEEFDSIEFPGINPDV